MKALVLILLTTTLAFASNTKIKSAAETAEEKCKNQLKRGPASDSVKVMEALSEDFESVAETKRQEALRAFGNTHEERRENINNLLSNTYKALLCNGANRNSFAEFTRLYTGIQSRVNNAHFQNLMHKDLAFYVDCGDQLNPFYHNMARSEINYEVNSISETTVELIEIMRPYLDEPGPNGEKALTHAKSHLANLDKQIASLELRDGEELSPEVLKLRGVYVLIIVQIEIQLKLKARTDGCVSASAFSQNACTEYRNPVTGVSSAECTTLQTAQAEKNDQLKSGRYLLAGSFEDKSEAEQLMRKMAMFFGMGTIVGEARLKHRNGSYRVYLGPYNSDYDFDREEATLLLLGIEVSRESKG